MLLSRPSAFPVCRQGAICTEDSACLQRAPVKPSLEPNPAQENSLRQALLEIWISRGNDYIREIPAPSGPPLNVWPRCAESSYHLVTKLGPQHTHGTSWVSTGLPKSHLALIDADHATPRGFTKERQRTLRLEEVTSIDMKQERNA